MISSFWSFLSVWSRLMPIPGSILHQPHPLAQAVRHDAGRKIPGIFRHPGHFLQLSDFCGLDLHAVDGQLSLHRDHDAVAAIDPPDFRSAGLIRFHLDGHGRSL